MANRYFVAGGVDNNWSTTGNWSLTSGGAGGQAVPTTADDVFLDGSSPNCIMNTATAKVCKSLNCVDGTGGEYANTLTMNVGCTVSGNIKFSAGMTFTPNTQTITVGATGSITSAGKSFYVLILACPATITLNDDAFVTNNLNLVAANNTTILNGYTLYLSGNSINSSSTAQVLQGSTVIYFNGTEDQTLTASAHSAGTTYANPITIDKDSGTLFFTRIIILTGALIWTKGDANFGIANIAFSMTDFTWAAGSIINGDSTIKFLSTLAIPLGFLNAFSGIFYNLTVGNWGKTITFPCDVTVNNIFAQTPGNGTDTLDGYTIYIKGDMTGSDDNAKGLTGTTAIIVNGTGNQTITCGSTGRWAINNSFTVVKNTGTFTIKQGVIPLALVVSAPNHPATTAVRKDTTYAPNNAYTGTKTAQAALAGL